MRSSSCRLGLRLLMLLSALFACGSAHAHEVRPAYLEITEDEQGRYDILWKQPTAGEIAVHLVPHLSSGWLDEPPNEVDAEPAFQIKLWKKIDAQGNDLAGQTLSIEGLEHTITDVLVNVTLSNGQQFQQVLRPQSPSLKIEFLRKGSLPAFGYLRLGVEHILTGIDHLMFVFGLLLIVKSRSQLLKAITAFTVAHSITLAGTALGLVRVHPAVVESLVALSIVFLAMELVQQRRGIERLTVHFPWVIAFTFGLLHGFAFAGALADIGLPKHNIPLALLLFNLGVEAGQLLFVGAVLALGWLLARLPRRLPSWSGWIPPYGIGAFSSFWFIERIHHIFE